MRRLLLPTLLFSLAFFAFAKARIEVPAGLDAVAPHTVTGKNPRTWNRPLAFGPWHTAAVREGATRSWSLEAFGLGGGASKRPYHVMLEGPDGARREVACMTRGAELWRGSFSVDLSRFTAPRLACAIREGERAPHAFLMLGQRGVELAGSLRLPDGTHEVVSIHKLAGSRIRSSEPVGYATRRESSVSLVVETINRGRVWLAPAADAEASADLAAAAAALLLFEPEISPRS